MKNLIDEINSSFIRRTTGIPLQRDIWVKVSEQFRPEISQYRAARPSTLIARETGDIGLSVLWIVQTALARPILKDIALNSVITEKISAILSSISSSSICSLAHSESSDNPVVVRNSGNMTSLTGEKKFITSGACADLIMISCRDEGEEKVGRIALAERGILPAGSLQNLDLNIFKSVNHSRLELHNFEAENGIIPEIDPSVLRRSLKKWGIIERALIMEAFISFLIYANRVFTSKGIIIASDEELITMEGMQSESAGRQINEAISGGMIETKNADIGNVLSILRRFKEKFAEGSEKFSEGEKLKFLDLSLFDNLKG